MSHKFRFENIDETRNYFVDGIEQNELMSSKHKKVCMTLNYIEQFLAFTVSYWMYFNFCFYFFTWYSYNNFDSCNKIKNLSNNCRNQKV